MPIIRMPEVSTNPMEKIISNDSELTESQHDVNNSISEQSTTIEELLE